MDRFLICQNPLSTEGDRKFIYHSDYPTLFLEIIEDLLPLTYSKLTHSGVYKDCYGNIKTVCISVFFVYSNNSNTKLLADVEAVLEDAWDFYMECIRKEIEQFKK